MSILLLLSKEASVSFKNELLFFSNVIQVILGGYVNGGDGGIQSTIAEYKDEQWTRLGDLKEARYGHTSIYDGIR